MLRSMYSGISGMKNFQTKLDVIGNNIANVNTYGFKKGRVVFKDLISQQIAGASGPGEVRGGVNARQIGLGSQLASVDTIHTIGATQTTSRPLDLAIAGDGFFVVGPDGGDDANFTRSGNFYLDEEGAIVNADGLYLLDTANARITIPLEAKSFSIGSDGKVTYIEDGNPEPQGDQIIGLAKFANPEGLEKVGSNLYRQSVNSGEYTESVAPGASGTGLLVPGALEMSNVDLSEEFTEMIVAQRGFQSNTKIITTSDEILQELMGLKR
ncbi:flagellar basal body rod protein FlgG [Metabacillus fastidiosus]|uniref:flagellar basal body rod protein FlgG n=1 Tax=Metabacillus fastidiosus TaxID=1458 RepID=UPI002E20B269|nr:flagellar basal body rod protein FlgG [Metabacillus fastidiosus]